MILKHIKICAIVMILAVVATSSSVYPGKKKLAQSGFQFLSVGSDARASAMGDAYTTVGANALFYNPSGLSYLSTKFDVTVNYNTWIADITHSSVAMAFNPKHGLFGVFGLSLNWVDYGDFEGTMVWSNPKGYVKTEVFNPTAISIGVGYAKSLTDRFSVGGQIRYVSQSLGRSIDQNSSGLSAKKNIASVTAVDFGTIYDTGVKSIKLGMSVRNFSQEFKFEEEGFQLPLTFRIGVSVNAFEFYNFASINHQLLVSIDRVHPRSFPEFFNIGFDYLFMDIFSLRVGYVSNQDEYDFSYGFGIKKFGVAFDYAYTPFGVFDKVQRITAHLSL